MRKIRAERLLSDYAGNPFFINRENTRPDHTIIGSGTFDGQVGMCWMVQWKPEAGNIECLSERKMAQLLMRSYVARKVAQ